MFINISEEEFESLIKVVMHLTWLTGGDEDNPWKEDIARTWDVIHRPDSSLVDINDVDFGDDFEIVKPSLPQS